MYKKSKKVFPNSTANAFHEDGDVKILKATSEHASYLQHRLRSTDIRECMIHGSSPWRALHEPLANPDAITWTGLYKDEPVCMFGLSPILSHSEINCGIVWMLGSSVIDENPLKFVRVSINMVNYMISVYDTIENVVPLDHEHTIKWLCSLGFMFAEEPTIINGFSCLRFVRCTDSITVRFQ